MLIAYVAADLNNIKIISACCFHFPDKVTETNINFLSVRNMMRQKAQRKAFCFFFFLTRLKCNLD